MQLPTAKWWARAIVLASTFAVACEADSWRGVSPGTPPAPSGDVALTPARGFSTWNAFPVHSIDEATGLPQLGYTYFIVDEPCFTGRSADGTLIENRTTWPNGLKAFGQELRDNGMKLGIYTCVGPTTCGGCIASEGHEDQDIQTFADWGAEYVKVDSCSRNCTPAAGITNTSMCGQILWTRYATAIAKTGKKMVYSIVCNCDPGRGAQPWKWAKGVANSWRTNIDIQVGFQAIPYIVDAQRRMSGNGTWCPDDPKSPSGPGFPCTSEGGGGQCRTCPGPEAFSGPGHFNDMDMLIVGTKSKLFPRPLNVPQARAQLSMWTILKSPLLASADFTNVSQPLIDVLKNKEVLAVSDDPLAREAIRLGDSGREDKSLGEIYVGAIQNGFAVVMFNRQGAPRNMTLAVSDCLSITQGTDSAWPTGVSDHRGLDLGSAASWNVRDLWAHTDNGTVLATGSVDATVPSTDVVMFTLTPAATTRRYE